MKAPLLESSLLVAGPAPLASLSDVDRRCEYLARRLLPSTRHVLREVVAEDRNVRRQLPKVGVGEVEALEGAGMAADVGQDLLSTLRNFAACGKLIRRRRS